MNKIIYFTLISIFASITLGQNSQSQNEMLNIVNTPKCAADMAKPTESVFITASLRSTGIILNNIAKQTEKDPATFVGEGLQFYKRKLVFLSSEIFNLMNSGQLPLVKSKSEAEYNLKNLKKINLVNHFEKINCLQVNAINTKYSNLFIRGVTKDALTELAKQYSTDQNQLNCGSQNITTEIELYPVFNFDLVNIKNKKNWNSIGFDFWDSFKIYLSQAWRINDVKSLPNSNLDNLTKLVPFEEQTLIISNGCKSVERPECSSQFLSSTELKNLFTTDRSKLEMTSSSLEMKDLLTDNTDKIDESIRLEMAAKSGENRWISDFQKSYMSFSSKNIENLYKANKLYSSVFTQKTLSQLKSDLEMEFSNSNNKEFAHYLCSEHRLLTQEQPLNLMKTDLENLEKNSAVFDQHLKYGMTVHEIVLAHKSVIPMLTQICDNFDTRIAETETDQAVWNKYAKWYKNFLSRYQIISALMNTEEKVEKNEVLPTVKNQTYINNLCENAIDCFRKMTESIVETNKLLIHSRSFLRTQIVSSPLFNDRADKVACKIYDPFEINRLNNKQLLTDIGTSVLFGWTQLPIYLDVQYKPKELVSFNKLVESGKITFDLDFKQQSEKSLALSLGSFVNVPCSISISTANYDKNAANNRLLFSGINVQACKGSKTQTVASVGSSVDQTEKLIKSNYKGCVECALNFKEVSTVSFLNVFSPLRSAVRLFESIMRYRNIRRSDVLNPREYNINVDYLVDTYKQYGEIPEKCVPLLARGLNCSPSACEELAKKDFESKTGIITDAVILKQSERRADKYVQATFISKSCKNPVSVKMKCSSNGSRFHLSVNDKDIQSCEVN